jgi:hypothetical protein
MADQQVPFEFQTQFGEASELDRIAQLMAQQRLINQRGMGGQIVPGGPGTPGIYVRSSPMQGLADMFAAYQQGASSRDAARIRREAQAGIAQAEQGQLQRMAALMSGQPETQEPGDFGPGERRTIPGVAPNPQAAEVWGMTSDYPRVKSLAEALQKNRLALVNAAGRNATTASIAASGGDPSKFQDKPRTSWTPELKNVAPPGAAKPIYAQQSSEGEFKYPPRDINVSSTANIEARGRWGIAEKLYENVQGEKGIAKTTGLKKTGDALVGAMNLIANVPVNTGVDSDWKTWAQSLSSITGAPVDPAVAGTQLYNSFIVPQIGEIIKMYGSGTAISNADREAAEKALALAKNDPRMIKVALAYTLRGAWKEANTHNAMVQQGRAEMQQLGGNPDMFNNEVTIQLPAEVAEAFGLPKDFVKPGMLESWTTKIMRPRATALDDAVKRNIGQPPTGVPY